MRFSVWPVAPQPWTHILALATQADSGFWHGVYVSDHFMTEDGGPQEILEATALLAALAAATSRIRLGNMVLSMTHRHPAVLANWAATVDRNQARAGSRWEWAPAGSSTSTSSTA